MAEHGTTSADARWEAVWAGEALIGLCACVLAVVFGRRGVAEEARD
jgi:putative Ca2+/H+ antiporter (TMEM165/GDT1 family)